jgi:inosine/xanthosine triphosphatase
MMKNVIVTSLNPVKIRAAKAGFQKMFPEESFQWEDLSTLSDVREQPISSEETLTGALNRAKNAIKIAGHADYWIGIEGGIEDHHGDMQAFAWVVIFGKTPDGKFISGKGRTGTFFLPHQIAQLVHQGKELGEADDIVFNKVNSKQENGAVGLLTGNVVDRQSLYEQAVILALIPFKNAHLYPNEKTVLE